MTETGASDGFVGESPFVEPLEPLSACGPEEVGVVVSESRRKVLYGISVRDDASDNDCSCLNGPKELPARLPGSARVAVEVVLVDGARGLLLISVERAKYAYIAGVSKTTRVNKK